MIKTDDIKKVVKLVLLSGYIKNAEPLSLMLVSDAGNGKTEMISGFISPRICLRTDIDYPTLIRILHEKKAIKHLILPDFIKITKKKRSSSNNLISLLNAVIEEGLQDMNLMNKDYHFRGRKIGLVTATTKASYLQHKKEWSAIGFMSRMIFCSFSYSNETIDEILQYINSEEFFKREPVMKLKGYKDIFVTPKLRLNQQLNPLVNKKFRTLKHLQTLTKANALCNDRKEVTQEDVDEIRRLSKYLNLNYTKI